MITIYTDIDTLFDTRRGIIEHTIKESGNLSFVWSEYNDIYRNRDMDFFDKPDIGLVHENYLARFAKRDVSDWVDSENGYCYFYPSNVLKFMLPAVRTIEWGSTQLIQVDEIVLNINLFPFDLSEELQTELLAHIRSSFKIPITINFVMVSFDRQTADYINNHNYVFRYGHLINPELEKWNTTYYNTELHGVTIFVPELLAKQPDNDPIYESLNEDSIKNRINKLSMLQQGKVIFIPTDKTVFDSCI